ncbi:endonuclease/exonuclease/phosphatase family protein [Clostridium oceanicum]|uniref:Endonuclease/exonuclease/phosphatase family protein n=1 Tax=Clostridium oceanicum TaxID=1543 RepID=A0ABN1JEH8_9CLOT
MKILTLNCHSWQEEKQLQKIKYLAKVIYEKKYDVIALQEVSQSIKSEKVLNNIKEDNFVFILLQELKKIGEDNFQFIWDFAHIGYDKYEEGIALLTKHPIKEKNTFYISNSSDIHFWKTRKIVKCTIPYKDKFISFYSCHLGWWNDKEEKFDFQVNNLIESLKKDEINLFMGDFNNDAFKRREGYDYLIEKGLKDTFYMAKSKDKGVTAIGEIDGWEGNSKDMRLDLILANKELEVEYSKVIFNGKNKDIISDHYGVEIKIDM